MVFRYTQKKSIRCRHYIVYRTNLIKIEESFVLSVPSYLQIKLLSFRTTSEARLLWTCRLIIVRLDFLESSQNDWKFFLTGISKRAIKLLWFHLSPIFMIPFLWISYISFSWLVQNTCQTELLLLHFRSLLFFLRISYFIFHSRHRNFSWK